MHLFIWQKVQKCTYPGVKAFVLSWIDLGFLGLAFLTSTERPCWAGESRSLTWSSTCRSRCWKMSASPEFPLVAHSCLRHGLRLSTAHLPSLPSHTWDNRCRGGWLGGWHLLNSPGLQRVAPSTLYYRPCVSQAHHTYAQSNFSVLLT